MLISCTAFSRASLSAQSDCRASSRISISAGGPPVPSGLSRFNHSSVLWFWSGYRSRNTLDEEVDPIESGFVETLGLVEDDLSGVVFDGANENWRAGLERGYRSR